MQEWPDDQLDDFFRKSAEGNDPEFDPRNWETLRERLDEADGVKSPWWKNNGWKALILAGLLALIGSVVYFWIGDDKSHQGDNKQKNLTAIPATRLPEPESDLINPAHSGNSTDFEKPENERNSTQKPQSVSRVNTPVTPAKGIAAPTAAQTQKIRSRRKEVAGGELQKPAGNIALRIGETPFISENPRPDPAPIETADSKIEDSKIQELKQNFLLLEPPRFHEKRFEFPVIKTVSTPNAAEPEVPRKNTIPTPSRRWALRIGAGPDLSAVRIRNFSSPTFAWAAHFDYRITRRLWLQTGYVKSNKKYEALPGDYTWPKRWYQDILPESVAATCDMVEIPLNLKYVMDLKKDATLHFSVGATNYQMRAEKYDYRYERPDPSIKWYTWEGSTGWYWASHLQVAAGYERRISNNFRIGVEPYVKIPTRKVGFGNVNLYTAGAWIYLSFGR